MSSYGHILVPKHESLGPKIANIDCFGPKPYLKTPDARQFGDQHCEKDTNKKLGINKRSVL